MRGTSAVLYVYIARDGKLWYVRLNRGLRARVDCGGDLSVLPVQYSTYPLHLLWAVHNLGMA